MKEFTYRGKPVRLSKIIAEQYPLFSYNHILKLITAKEATVDGRRVNSDITVGDGSVVRCYAAMSLSAVFEDDNLLVVYKPKGIASEGNISAESIVHEKNPTFILCHRLDTNTDGLLMFAKNQRAFEAMQEGARAGCIEKTYSAHVYGRVTGEINYNDFLFKDAKAGRVAVYDKKRAGAVNAILRAYPVESYGETTLLEVVIKQGKTHQIRAQLAAHGHFVLGDSKYGRDDINRKFNFKKQQLTAIKLKFSFPNDSFLSYLNRNSISLR